MRFLTCRLQTASLPTASPGPIAERFRSDSSQKQIFTEPNVVSVCQLGYFFLTAPWLLSGLEKLRNVENTSRPRT